MSGLEPLIAAMMAAAPTAAGTAAMVTPAAGAASLFGPAAGSLGASLLAPAAAAAIPTAGLGGTAASTFGLSGLLGSGGTALAASEIPALPGLLSKLESAGLGKELAANPFKATAMDRAKDGIAGFGRAAMIANAFQPDEPQRPGLLPMPSGPAPQLPADSSPFAGIYGGGQMTDEERKRLLMMMQQQGGRYG